MSCGVGSEVECSRCGGIGKEEDTARAGPELVERLLCLEYLWGVRPEAAVPEAIDATVDEMNLLAGVEDQG